MSDPLKRLAQRVQSDRQFLASLLDEYARAEGLNDAVLAQQLGCTPERLTGVRLCRAPRADAAGFRQDVRQVAECFGLDAVRLTALIRQGEAFRLLREGGVGAPGFLMAARDRPPEEEE